MRSLTLLNECHTRPQNDRSIEESWVQDQWAYYWFAFLKLVLLYHCLRWMLKSWWMHLYKKIRLTMVSWIYNMHSKTLYWLLWGPRHMVSSCCIFSAFFCPLCITWSKLGAALIAKKKNKKTLKLSKTLSLWSEKREQVWILGRIKCSWNFNPNSTDVFFSTKRQFLCQNPKSINFKDCPRWNKHHKENERASTGKTTVCVCACVHVCTCVCVVCVIDRRVWPKAQYDLTACLISQRSQFYTSLGSG